ncbi:MAG: ammonia channel protein [Candidatus Goldiibacteriota bacterium HGW-Goldbacteria-1]|nr:MAG: ammonia channel protein [Candidatus Goldiibacteriota bacterium HGW-Goldbacteria-1]
MNGADTAWVLMSAALVMLMTPALGFFYGGMVRKKNVLSVLMKAFITLAVISMQWMVIGYSLSFGEGNGFIGGFQHFMLNGVGQEGSNYAPNIPGLAFMIFQAMFAVITPALIFGAFVERVKFSSFLLFTVLWATFIYNPICHWVWGKGGWLAEMGALDFAGGIVVHVSAGIAALVTAFVIGKRKGTESLGPIPHNLPFTVLGAGLLWFGWFGFNAGSALGANGIAANAFVTTNMAASSAAVTWAVIEWIRNGKPTMLGTVSGAIAGLATITPSAGFVDAGAALIIGVIASMFCFVAVSIIKMKFKYDDSLDAFGVHGVGGMIGPLLTGVFANPAVNALGTGLLFGNPKQLGIQAVAVGATIAYSFIGTFIIFKAIDLLMGVRLKERDENIGVDLSQHNERAYTLIE